MKKTSLPVLIITFLVISQLACSLSQISRVFGELPTGSGELLFQDGFEDPSSGWDRVRNDEGLTDYDEGRYRIMVNTTNADYWSNPGLYFENVQVDVDTGMLGGPEDNDFGVLCRYQDTKNFYFLIISSDGYYGIGLVENGEQKLLEPPQMYESEAVNQGDYPNHIRATCDGDLLALEVNNQLIAETRDSTFRTGDIGLIVGSFDEPGVDIWFDNLTVRVP